MAWQRQFACNCRWLALPALVCCVMAAPAADAVLVVFNQDSPVSRTITEYYARKRHVPKTNLCGISAPEQETVSREVYERRIEAAVGECLKSRGLTEKILYLVTTNGVPLRVSGRTGLDGDNAAVDSELTLLYAKLHGRPFPVDGIVPNPLFNRPDAEFRRPRFPIYLVTRLAAYDFEGVRGLIDRSLLAKNRGKFVLDARTSSERQGDDWLRTAAILLPSDRTVFDDSIKVVLNEHDVIGYAAWGSNDPLRKTRTARFSWLPGAVMTEYVSTNARTFRRPPAGWRIGPWKDRSRLFAGSPQTLIADYIAEGVTGVAGHIDEPYLHLTVRPNLLLHAWYSGRTLAEAFYVAIPALSWQTMVVGDPLCSLGKP